MRWGERVPERVSRVSRFSNAKSASVQDSVFDLSGDQALQRDLAAVLHLVIHIFLYRPSSSSALFPNNFAPDNASIEAIKLILNERWAQTEVLGRRVT